MTCHFTWIDSPLPVDALGGALWRLLGATAGEDAILGIDDQHDSKAQEALLRQLKQTLAGGGHLLIGSVHGRLVVACVLKPQSLPTTCHLAELQKGVIAPEYRGQGLLPAALRQITEKARQLGVSRLLLDVRAGSLPHRLWQHWGFRTFGVLEDYARHNGEVFAGHFMQQSVDDLAIRVARRLNKSRYPKDTGATTASSDQ
ncbi:Protein N-acetyltransferase, RimJ/RimL family [Marinobacter daqiaonensis]|uniref:Protein N-acetyltransferase, RimJ/RimL family n=1 Tax=Marinobacter daqiaonensis TaxID=650891 RepID=A0A1I6GU47_9GAMM|nr:GNAT family N-acetyltransferase [Marinobacter daqiaonensis]SFR45764.1 Protein N-acetyltransferase, RimJ/RimL family [Marinobacter daqiaonensis]